MRQHSDICPACETDCLCDECGNPCTRCDCEENAEQMFLEPMRALGLSDSDFLVPDPPAEEHP